MNQSSKIQTLSVRFPSHLYSKVCAEAEQQGITNAEAIRIMVQQYFSDRDEVTRLNAMQTAILSAIRNSEESIGQQINSLVAD
jgi:metal-responsive CopG/Arc/MetJ family transcriptional regulator